MVFKFWKTHGAEMLKIIEKPVSNYNQGISQVDWELHLIAHSRHQSSISKQSATMMIKSKDGEKIQFEMSKNDVDSILDKIDSVL